MEDLLVKEIVKAIDDKKGLDIQVLDIHAQTGIGDYFVICTGQTKTQTKAIADFIEEKVQTNLETTVLRREGFQTGEWILLDYGSVIVQIFQPETREYYKLEKLWAQAPVVDISEWVQEA